MPCVPAALQPSKIKGMKLPQDKATQAKPGRGHDCHPNPVPAFSTCKVTRKHQPGDGSWAHTCHREQALAKARTPWRKSSSPRKDLYNIASFSQTLYSKSQQHSSSFDTTAKKLYWCQAGRVTWQGYSLELEQISQRRWLITMGSQLLSLATSHRAFIFPSLPSCSAFKLPWCFLKSQAWRHQQLLIPKGSHLFVWRAASLQKPPGNTHLF